MFDPGNEQNRRRHGISDLVRRPGGTSRPAERGPRELLINLDVSGFLAHGTPSAAIPRLTGSMDSLRRWLLLTAEKASWTLGVAGLLGLGVFHVWTVTSTRADLERFRALQGGARQAGAPDQTLWSPVR